VNASKQEQLLRCWRIPQTLCQRLYLSITWPMMARIDETAAGAAMVPRTPRRQDPWLTVGVLMSTASHIPKVEEDRQTGVELASQAREVPEPLSLTAPGFTYFAVGCHELTFARYAASRASTRQPRTDRQSRGSLITLLPGWAWTARGNSGKVTESNRTDANVSAGQASCHQTIVCPPATTDRNGRQ
jgi:hypothetical protein